ncbi:iron hydrogenase [Clostridium novyi A str. BKT29909]|uniref:4Fe-4S dicluster domain-containing protein n=1 Tax=Clostridium TaxID=1485 RepID=UPI0004D53721|nr:MULTISPECIES: 4Fe-4S dicluster domain-containing protein [Clostridium]KEH90867.1 iron hydrogenase [Clostridium novyi A str. BKT29909]KEH93872.1 iron hydrogenase [Clostridium botulinum C/D str. It1]
MKFETELNRVKYEVLKEVAILAKEDRLDKENVENISYNLIKGDKPQYRCCVYHERAIVKERVKLVAGYIPNGDSPKYIKQDDNDGKIMYVIEAACDRCPINKYTITEACRGCVQHKCMEVCPVKAITKINGRAYINQDVCRECGMCKQVCPYNAISEVMRPCKKVCPTEAICISPQDRRAEINDEECISCGACMKACPFGAISDKSYIVPVVEAIKNNKKVYALVAPAITGQFGPKVTVGQVKDGLKKAGFVDMIEAACGADAVTCHEAEEFVERMEKGDNFMTNSCCPAFVSYIEKKFPDQVEKISGTVSPMIATGRWIKKKEEDAIVVFVGPCTAKKSEIGREGLKDAVDYVLTFEEIAAIFGAYNVEVEECEDLEVEDASALGRGFAQGGGLSAAVENYISSKNIEVEFKPVKISGHQNLRKFMMLAKNNKLPGNFFEGMMCEGGCIGGAASTAPQMKTKMALNKFVKESKKQQVIDNDKLDEYKDIELER